MFGGTPEPALIAGMAGVIPYAAASIATLLLTWDINAATHTSTALKGATASNGMTSFLFVSLMVSVLFGSPDCAALVGCVAAYSNRLWSCLAFFPRGNPLGS